MTVADLNAELADTTLGGVADGDIPMLEDVGGSPGLPAVDGSQLTGIGGVATPFGSWAYNATTSKADPGAGTFRLNHATSSSATELYINDADAAGVTIVLDDVWRAGDKIYLNNAAEAMLVDVTSVTDETGYYTVVFTVDSASADTTWTATNEFFITAAGGAIAGVIDAGQITTGTFDSARITEASVTQHEAALDHNELFNHDPDEHYPILNSTQASRPPAGDSPNSMHVSTDTSVLVHSQSGSWNAVTTTTADADALNSATTTVNVSAATAPTIDQVLTATSSTAATWQDASGGVTGPVGSTDGTLVLWDGTGGDTLKSGTSATVTASGGYQAQSGTLTGIQGGNFVNVSGGSSDAGVNAIGSLLYGQATGSGSTINTTDIGAIAGGKAASGADILASGIGSFARGQLLAPVTITASGIASTAIAYGTQNTTASGNASFCMSASFAAVASTSGDNSMQIGPGVNVEATSICVGDIGSGGIRLIGDGAVSASPQNGDFYCDGTHVHVYTNGGWKSMTDIP